LRGSTHPCRLLEVHASNGPIRSWSAATGSRRWSSSPAVSIPLALQGSRGSTSSRAPRTVVSSPSTDRRFSTDRVRGSPRACASSRRPCAPGAVMPRPRAPAYWNQPATSRTALMTPRLL
jgi:hypothetical protein